VAAHVRRRLSPRARVNDGFTAGEEVVGRRSLFLS